MLIDMRALFLHELYISNRRGTNILFHNILCPLKSDERYDYNIILKV